MVGWRAARVRPRANGEGSRPVAAAAHAVARGEGGPGFRERHGVATIGVRRPAIFLVDRSGGQ
jgi:hypothetical protein